jgi:hypothetical protein
LDAQVTQDIRYTDDDAVGTDVAEHAADGALEKLQQRIEFGGPHMLAE